MKKTIFITGASTGIGKATAKYFAEQGWNVAATMRNPQNETELINLENVKVYQLDVTDLDSIDKAVSEAIKDFGKVDVVLNNAGYGLIAAFETASREQIKRQFDTNLFGLMDVTRAFLPHFRENKSGQFLNVSSVGGRMAFPYISLYHGTKWAVEGFSESLRMELRNLGIGVKIIEPGGVKTDFASRSIDLVVPEKYEDYQEDFNKFNSKMMEIVESGNSSTSEYLAEEIYKAATDGKDRLRYLIGEDAKEYMATRKQLGDEEFIKTFAKQLFE